MGLLGARAGERLMEGICRQVVRCVFPTCHTSGCFMEAEGVLSVFISSFWGNRWLGMCSQVAGCLSNMLDLDNSGSGVLSNHGVDHRQTLLEFSSNACLESCVHQSATRCV